MAEYLNSPAMVQYSGSVAFHRPRLYESEVSEDHQIMFPSFDVPRYAWATSFNVACYCHAATKKPHFYGAAQEKNRVAVIPDSTKATVMASRAACLTTRLLCVQCTSKVCSRTHALVVISH